LPRGLPSASAQAAWDQVTQSGSPYQAEYRLRRKDGAYRWHLACALLDGALQRWVGTCTDIDDQLRAAPERVPDGPVVGGSETVLLVEDEDPVRAVSARLLETLGYRVLQAANAEEALHRFAASQIKIDLLMTDVVIPGRNGRELAEILRARDAGLKVLFQSGYTGDAVVRRGILNAEVAFLKKPFTLDALARKVREVLDGRWGVGCVYF
jgi:CheY-like chemotaxis protein